LNGEPFPLVQVAEPIPLRIVGNALAFQNQHDLSRRRRMACVHWRTGG